VQPNPHTNWVLGLRDVRIKVKRVLPSSFLAQTITKRKKHSNQPKPATHPISSHPLTPREVRIKKPPSQERKLLFSCFVAMLVTLMSFASSARESRRGTLIMLETHIIRSLLIFRLSLILVLRLILLLILCLASLMDLTIAHMVLAHERTTLCLDALITAHVLIVVIISHVGLVFLLEGLTLTLSPDTWTVHVFPVVVLVPLVQRVRCKSL
jgi:hypothetical protein